MKNQNKNRKKAWKMSVTHRNKNILIGRRMSIKIAAAAAADGDPVQLSKLNITLCTCPCHCTLCIWPSHLVTYLCVSLFYIVRYFMWIYGHLLLRARHIQIRLKNFQKSLFQLEDTESWWNDHEPMYLCIVHSRHVVWFICKKTYTYIFIVCSVSFWNSRKFIK